MPGSPQATPEGAESGGPQELLKPLHILDGPGRKQRRRRRGLADGQKRVAYRALSGSKATTVPASLPEKGQSTGSRQQRACLAGT